MAADKRNRYPSYHPRDYPVGIDDFLNTFPSHRRKEVLAAVVNLHLGGKAEEKWVRRQVDGMLELPSILYKYAPLERLDDGFPGTLRATQTAALNDVMEGNISTEMESKMDRDQWYAMVLESLAHIFGNDAFSQEELERRKKLYGDPRISTIIRDYLSRFVGVISFSADPLIPTMWAHYAKNSGFVAGYNTNVLKEHGGDRGSLCRLEHAERESQKNRARCQCG